MSNEEPKKEKTPLDVLYDEIKVGANKIAEEKDLDVLYYHNRIQRPYDDRIIELCKSRKLRSNVLLFVVTSGGIPEAAYRISRCLQSKYNKFTVYISDFCKSAGTLLCLGAHEIVISDIGEMGPLDVQVQKQDELFEMSSGLNLINALTLSQTQAYSMIENYINKFKDTSNNQITLKTAADIASRMAIGLFGKIYEQIDPEKLGEISRSMKIAEEYGRRLNKKSNNLKGEALNKLIEGYPTHSFTIDRMEAKELFKNVREPDAAEEQFCNLLYKYVKQIDRGTTLYGFVTDVKEGA